MYFPSFSRAESTRNLAPLANLLGVDINEMKAKMLALSGTAGYNSHFSRFLFSFQASFNLQRLGTKP